MKKTNAVIFLTTLFLFYYSIVVSISPSPIGKVGFFLVAFIYLSVLLLAIDKKKGRPINNRYVKAVLLTICLYSGLMFIKMYYLYLDLFIDKLIVLTSIRYINTQDCVDIMLISATAFPLIYMICFVLIIKKKSNSNKFTIKAQLVFKQISEKLIYYKSVSKGFMYKTIP